MVLHEKQRQRSVRLWPAARTIACGRAETSKPEPARKHGEQSAAVSIRPIVVVELRAKPSFRVEQSGRPKRTFDVALEYKVRPQFCSIVCFVLGNGGVPEYEGINNLMLF